MRKIIESVISVKATLWLLAAFTAGMGIATFVENSYDTATARKYIYNALWFELTIVLLAVNFIGNIKRYHLYRKEKWAGLVFHSAFIVMIIGAGVTRYIGYEGTMYIREGESSNILLVAQPSATNNGQANEVKLELPFSIYLEDFILERYAGSTSPSSYESEVRIIDNNNHVDQPYRIYMNKVLDYGGYRFFQSSYFQDEQGTILSVSHDRAGTYITYAGYFLLGLGFAISFFTKASRFTFLRKEIRKIRAARKAPLALILLVLASTTYSQSDTHFVVSKKQAESFGRLLVQTYDGRTEPIHTLAYDVMHKIARKDHFEIPGIGQADAMQVFMDLMQNNAFWQAQPIIYVREASVQNALGISGKYASYNDFFDFNNRFKLIRQSEDAFRKKPAEQTKFDKEIIKVSERVNIFSSIYRGAMLRVFPDPSSTENNWVSVNSVQASLPLQGSINLINEDLQLPVFNYTNIFKLYLTEVANGARTNDYSRADKVLHYLESIQRQDKFAGFTPSRQKVKTEIFYNKAQIFIRLKNWLGLLSIVLLLLAFIENLRSKRSPILSYLLNACTVLLVIAFICHTAGMTLRWYLTGHAPWSNGYEALLLVAWGSMLAGFSFARYSKIALAATALLAFFTLMTASHSNYDPQLTNLVPVLKSYWLIIHVATLTISYSFLGLAFLLGIFNMALYLFQTHRNKERLNLLIKELSYINEMNMMIGLILATVGCFLGGIWANESWGRYWGWDAKETWALVIIIVYAIVLHLRLLPKFSLFVFNLAAIFAFGSVLMTFIGVNYYLTKGMHSYGAGDTPVFPAWAWLMIISLFGLIFASAYKNKQINYK